VKPPDLRRLRKELAYFPEKGEFWWILPKNGRPMNRQAGSVCGKNKTGYRQIYFDGKPYHAPSLAWYMVTGKWPARIVEHKNLIRTDDRWDNYRLATRSENYANKRAYKNNKSGFKGVSFFKSRGKWIAQIQVNKKKINLGYYATPEQAHVAYVAAATKYFGEFARVS